MGAYLHFVYLAARSIWVSVTLHALNNTVAVVALMSNLGETLDTGTGVHAIATYLAAFALLLFGSIAMWTGRSRIVPIDGGAVQEETTTWTPEYPGISAPPRRSGLQLVRGTASPAACALTLLAFAIVVVLLFM